MTQMSCSHSLRSACGLKHGRVEHGHFVSCPSVWWLITVPDEHSLGYMHTVWHGAYISADNSKTCQTSAGVKGLNRPQASVTCPPGEPAGRKTSATPFLRENCGGTRSWEWLRFAIPVRLDSVKAARSLPVTWFAHVSGGMCEGGVRPKVEGEGVPNWQRRPHVLTPNCRNTYVAYFTWCQGKIQSDSFIKLKLSRF